MKRKRKLIDLTYRRTERRRASIMACTLFWSVISYLVISRFVLNGVEVEGCSMEPTLRDGDRLFLDHWSRYVSSLQRGDVVAVRVPGYDGVSIKRIIALPRETVQICRGRVFVNNRELEESYVSEKTWTPEGDLGTNLHEVVEGYYFVLGDNRCNSVDSRAFGSVPRKWILGKAASLGYAQYKY